ncbi:MAG: hypothetical protein ABR587_02605 [Candidatus Binatia bacterium]
MRTSLVATAVAISIHGMAQAETQPAAGYIYTREVLGELTEGCVAHAHGGVFVAVGPALAFPASGGTRDILFVSADSSVRTVATGLNAVGDCVYDAASDTLYVTDSGLEFSGATAGDTVFAIPGDATDADVAQFELLPSGTVPYAFSIDFFGSGLLVSDAAGGGLGSVIEIDLSGGEPAASTFASGFDYTGGVFVDGDRVLVGEAVQPNFDSAVYEYSSAGVLQSTLSGPTFDHGSNDLAVAGDGRVLATGGSTIVAIDDVGAVAPLVTGLDGGSGFAAFGGGVAVDEFTGRIDFLASSFSGADDDKSIHRLVPVDRLLTRGGDPVGDCAMELFGVELVPRAVGRPARAAICEDGAACDADGAADGVCTYPLGLCFNVSDPRLPECTPSAVSQVTLVRARPEGAGAEALAAAAAAVLPMSESTCVFGQGVRIPLREDGTRRGKGRVFLRADGAGGVRDYDVVKLICEPAR